MKIIKRVIVLTCLFIAALLITDSLLTKKLESIYDDSIGHAYEVDLSQYKFNTSLNRNNLMLLGSSELGTLVPQNPRDFLPINTFKKVPTIIGAAHVQDLQHSINIGSYDGDYKDKNVVLVVSLQWFYEPKGIDADSFIPHFSPIKYYNFIDNSKLSSETKQKVSSRVLQVIKGQSRFYPEYLYGLMHEGNVWYKQVGKVVFKPYYWTRKRVLSIRDKVDIYNKVKNVKKIDYSVKDVQWDKEFEKAAEQGKKVCTNNPYYVSDEYYDQYLSPIMDVLHNRYTNLDLLNSKELEDYKNLLQVAKERELKPLVVLMPVNGYFYDYMGLSKAKRDEFYNSLQGMAESKGFKVLNYSQKEYEPYFMSDIMHLGWRGWLQIDKDIVEHFSK